MRNRKAIAKPFKEKNFLVTDYDSCALTIYGSHPLLISKPIIAYTEQHKELDGFYGLSGRHFRKDNGKLNFLELLTFLAAKKADQTNYSKKMIEINYSTYKVTENLEIATGLKCEAVSTGEDLLDGRICGQGYEAVIKPYEMKGIVPAEDKRIHVEDMKKRGIDLSKSKNPLLLQIAQHAVKQNPKQNILLHVFEDNKNCAESAQKVWQDPYWPTNVKVTVTWIDGKGDKAKLVAMNDKVKPVAAKEAVEAKEVKSARDIAKLRYYFNKLKPVRMEVDAAESKEKNVSKKRKLPEAEVEKPSKKQKTAASIAALATQSTFSRRVTRSTSAAAAAVAGDEKPSLQRRRAW